VIPKLFQNNFHSHVITALVALVGLGSVGLG